MTTIDGWVARLRILGYLAVLFLAVPAYPSHEEAVSGKEFPVIESVSFQVSSAYQVSYEELTGLVTVHPGSPLTPNVIKESIRRLNQKSLFREIDAYVRMDGGKAQVLFYLRPMPVVSDIEVRGAKRIPASQVQAASRIRRGKPVDEGKLSRAKESVLSLLRGKGFVDAEVSVSATCSMVTGAGTVQIRMREGSPGSVKEVRVRGGKAIPPDRQKEFLRVTPGFPFNYQRWEKGITKLREEYKKEGFLTVRIAETGIACEDKAWICPSVSVEEGPRYEVTWEGANRFSVATLEKESGIYDPERESSEGGVVFELKERLLAFYQNRDYLKAEVDVEVKEKPGGGRMLTIAVREGQRGYLKSILFTGNENIPAKTLRNQMLSRVRGPFHYITGSGDFDRDEWSADLAALIGLYQKEGFARASITSVDTEWDEEGGITATVHIKEGKRYELTEIRFRGNDHFLRKELLALIGNREGKSFDYAGVEHDEDAVATHYRNAGYLDVSVNVKPDIDDGTGTATLSFEIVEGPRYRLGTIVVQGNVLTDSEVVYREVTIPNGSPAGESDLLAFQQAVYRTGLYKSVRLQRIKRSDEGILDLVVELEETFFFQVEYGVGYGSYTGIRGFVGATDKNLNGKGRRFSTSVHASEVEQVYLASLREPWVFGNRWKWEGALTASYTESQRESFSFRKAGVGASINKTIFARSSLSLQYELSRDDIYDVQPGAVLSPEDQGIDVISAVRGVFVLDFRDDPFNPTRGTFHSGSAELSPSVLGSEVDYYKLVGQTSWYHPVFRRNVFVVNARAGVVRAYGSTEQVPIQKRFFLGGRTTVRGFDEDSIGPRGPDGSYTGGDYMVNTNVELRVPLLYGFIVAFFMDTGSVWLNDQPGYDFDLRESAGLGLRYITPIGPVAVDYGYKLDRKEGESPSKWHFTIGAVF